jgi:hypothetical protein
VEYLKGTSLLAVPKKIRIGWKGLPEATTVAYYEHLQITNVNKFTTLGLAKC